MVESKERRRHFMAVKYLMPGTVKEQAAELGKLLSGKIYAISSDEPLGRQITVVIPYGKYRGVTLWFRVMRMMAVAAWRDCS